MDENHVKKISTILEKEVNVKFSDIDPEKDIREQVSLDSMQFVKIIAILEEEFKIELPISIMEVSTLKEFLSIIDKELQNT